MGINKKRVLFIFVSVCFFPAGWFSLSAIPAENEILFEPGKDGWVSLFDGATLRGWKTEDGSDWILKENILSGTKGEILNRWCWVDFEMIASVWGNGILRFRAGSDQVGHIGYNQPGYRFDLENGTLQTKDGIAFAKSNSKTSTAKWRELRLVATKGSYTIFLDNQKVIEGKEDSFLEKGRIGFIANGKPMQIKRLRVRPLGIKKMINIPSDNSFCYVCHMNFEEDEMASLHDEQDISCVECHGPSLVHRQDEDNVTPPDILYRRTEVDQTCLKCHDRHDEQENPKDSPLPKNPICTDCHGDHRIPIW